MEISFIRAINWAADKLELSADNRRIAENVARKADRFVSENKSLVFFGLSALFAYFTATWRIPMEYVVRVIISGMIEGIMILALANFFGSKGISQANSDRINYLLGGATLLERFISPWNSDFVALTNMGWVAAKEAYRAIWPVEPRRRAVEVELPPAPEYNAQRRASV